VANPEHVKMLLQGAKTWNQWKSEFVRGKADLRHADLRGANLVSADLRSADLKGVFLISANLRGAHLEQADLSGADLRGAFLTKTNSGGANLTCANLRGAHLEQADLRYANLTEAILISADLTQAYLAQANLNGVNLTAAILAHADLRSAILISADLTHAYLTRANLAEAHLYRAKFNGTSLHQTDFTNAKLAETVFANTNLGEAKDLATVNHAGPSTLGFDTLARSGNLPQVFLRGCGLSEEFIDYLPSLINRPITFYSCFISYSHIDATFARQLHDFLQGRGIRCWLDEKQLLPGHDLHDEVDRGIKLWDKVLLCASEASLNSWWVDKEITHTFAKERVLTERKGKKVRALIPLDLDGFLFDGWENSDADEVRKRLAADFTGWETNNQKLQEQFERVLKALRTDGGRELPPRATH